ncbi:MAG: diguanylate cyclase, partial [Pseudomonadota bacterium]
EQLVNEWRRAHRGQQPLSLILADVDYFKAYNDHYGHLAGDDCLIEVAEVLADIVRRSGSVVARYGGEEFAVILPDTPFEAAKACAEKARAGLQQRALAHAASPVEATVTLSLGVACAVPSAVGDPQALIAAADSALYRAKHSGRNQVEAQHLSGAGHSPTTPTEAASR